MSAHQLRSGMGTTAAWPLQRSEGEPIQEAITGKILMQNDMTEFKPQRD